MFFDHHVTHHRFRLRGDRVTRQYLTYFQSTRHDVINVVDDFRRTIDNHLLSRPTQPTLQAVKNTYRKPIVSSNRFGFLSIRYGEKYQFVAIHNIVKNRHRRRCYVASVADNTCMATVDDVPPLLGCAQLINGFYPDFYLPSVTPLHCWIKPRLR